MSQTEPKHPTSPRWVEEPTRAAPQLKGVPNHQAPPHCQRCPGPDAGGCILLTKLKLASPRVGDKVWRQVTHVKYITLTWTACH